MPSPNLKETEMETRERVKPVILSFEDGHEYTLEYDRAAVKYIEDLGFDMDAMGQKTMTMMSLLFYGAFRKNYPSKTIAETDEILFDQIGISNCEGLTTRLVQLYDQAFRPLYVESAEDGESKNPRVKVIL